MRLNERNNEVYDEHEADSHPAFAVPPENYYDQCRYYYDGLLNGWKQYDTKEDASYLGVWVHVEKRLTFTYAEGDRCLVVCPTEESFKEELADMARFYGPPPPAIITYDGNGHKTLVYDARPE
jgi:hypothetical protein